MTVKIILYSRGEYSRAKEMRGGSRFVDTAPGAKRKGRRLAKRERERESRNSFMENSRFFISPSFPPLRVGSSPLEPRLHTPCTSAKGGRGKKVWDVWRKSSTRRIFHILFCATSSLENAWRNGGGRKEGDRVEPTGWFANRAERHCSRLFARPSFTLHTHTQHTHNTHTFSLLLSRPSIAVEQRTPAPLARADRPRR